MDTKLFLLDQLKCFPNLSPKAFQHPDDEKATSMLRSVPFFPTVVEKFTDGVAEKAGHLQHLSECIRVGPSQAVEVYRLFVKAAEILSISEMPALFISPDYIVNAYAMGMRRHAIIVTRGLIELMSLPEVMGVLGHELGHFKCGHMVNKTIATMIAQVGVTGIAKLVPLLGENALLSITVPLQHWSRMTELSCDRAALLVVQDPEIVATMLAKLGGWSSNLGAINMQSLRKQGEEYDRLDDDSVTAALKIINMLQSSLYISHPLPI